MAIAWALLGGATALSGYAYFIYPLTLRALCALRGWGLRPSDGWHPSAFAEPPTWPSVSILVPVHNAADVLPRTLESLLALRYPGQRQILVVSDASTDATDEIAARFASRGIELVRLPVRRGKTAAENLASGHVRGDIVVTVDASSRVPPDALTPLVAAFADPQVGVASGRDVSVAGGARPAVTPEADYVGYEMWVRRWETAFGGIVGASGCFYAVRAGLYRHPLPEHMSRDFAASLVAQRHGYRAVAVDAAVCHVARTVSLAHEYQRKVRTITRGMATLWHFRDLLNPRRHGWFTWMLCSHKVCRWLVPWALLGALAGLAFLAASNAWTTAVFLAGTGAGAAAAVLGLSRGAPRSFRTLAFGAAANLAVLHAWVNCCRGRVAPCWEPTRRKVESTNLPAGQASPEGSGP